MDNEKNPVSNHDNDNIKFTYFFVYDKMGKYHCILFFYFFCLFFGV